MIKKIRNFKFVIRLPALLRKALRAGNRQAGMTYVELIVVLSIFAVMTSVVLFNYGKFQEQVDIKVLANDIASKIVEAQKAAMSGEILVTPPSDDWKPSYGVYFDLSTERYPDGVSHNERFTYFADIDNNNNYDVALDTSSATADITITKEDSVKDITAYFTDGTKDPLNGTLSITFTRPDSGAVFYDGTTGKISSVNYLEITVQSPGSNPSVGYIDIYPSGRIQVK